MGATSNNIFSSGGTTYPSISDNGTEVNISPNDRFDIGTDFVDINGSVEIALTSLLIKLKSDYVAIANIGGSVGFYGTTATPQQTAPTNPTGGIFIDDRARIAIDSIINILNTLGLTI